MMRTTRNFSHLSQHERMIRHIQGVNLPFGVSFRQIIYFFSLEFVMWLINQFPPIHATGWEFGKFFAIPVTLTWFLTKQTIDGKTPHRFVYRFLRHYFSPKMHNRCRYLNPGKTYVLKGQIGFRVWKQEEREE